MGGCLVSIPATSFSAAGGIRVSALTERTVDSARCRLAAGAPQAPPTQRPCVRRQYVRIVLVRRRSFVSNTSATRARIVVRAFPATASWWHTKLRGLLRFAHRPPAISGYSKGGGLLAMPGIQKQPGLRASKYRGFWKLGTATGGE